MNPSTDGVPPGALAAVLALGLEEPGPGQPPPGGAAGAESDPPQAADAGAFPAVAGYRITARVGEGGMGTVYDAEQDRPRRRVALKLVRPGLVSAAMLRRFEFEADVLGRLDHPGVARIFHAGVTPTPLGDQPYFAMELVRGTPLHQWVRRENPPHRRRIELLVAVCEAVHHAHTKGVIHRDLKPSNILVTDDGRPKVLDFGVARATDADVRSATLNTESGQLVGTLPYMAPEQAAGRVRELDTACDVYALGVIAYELLAGRMPYALEDKPLHEAVRVICEQDPPPLSSIDRSLRGDVETIVGKALQKDKARRYATAGDLAADLRRHLDYEPIAARRPGRWYQLRKFARRNKLAVAGVATVMLLLAAGVLTSTGFALRADARRREALEAQRQLYGEVANARQQAAAAQAVSDFLTRTLSAADPDRMLGDKVTVLQAVREAAKDLDGGALAGRPVVEAAVRTSVGKTLHALSRYAEAAPHLRRALELRRGGLPPGDREVATSINDLAVALKNDGNLDEAESLYREALELTRRYRPDDHRDTAAHLHNLARVLETRGKAAEAEKLYRESVDLVRWALPPDHPDVGASLGGLGWLLRSQHRLDEAEPLLVEALDVRRKSLPAGHPGIAWSLANLASLLQARGDFDRSEALYREALEIDRSRLPEGHPTISVRLGELGDLLQARGEAGKAEEAFRESLAIARNAWPPEHAALAAPANNLAYALEAQGRLDEAEPLLVEALGIFRKTLPPGHRDTARALNNYGRLLAARGRPQDAVPLLREAREALAALPPAHPDRAAAAHDLARVLKSRAGSDRAGSDRASGDRAGGDRGRADEAESLFREAIRGWRQALPPGDPRLAGALNQLALLLNEGGNLEEAEPLLAELDARVPALRVDPRQAAQWSVGYGVCLANLRRFAEAEEPLRRAGRRLRDTGQGESPSMKSVLEALADVCEHTGRPDEAERLRAELSGLSSAGPPASAPTTQPAAARAPAHREPNRR